MKKIKELKKKTGKFFCRYINGTRGVISLFLAILLMPFLSIAGILVNAARINSAVAIFDEALCNASNSTLGTYDEFLKKRFGLLAMSQDPNKLGGDYTAEQFISKTFSFYMEQCMPVLSNTYTASEVDAEGIYPLADTDVLLTSVLEHSKYTIPAKMVVDGLSLDDLLKSLTEKLKMVTGIFNTLSAGADVATKFDGCQDQIDILVVELDELKTAINNYDSAYTAFEDAVSSYNDVYDEMVREVGECEQAVATAQSTATSKREAYDSAVEEYVWIRDEISELENQVDKNGKPVDNSKKIKQLEEDYADELDELDTAQNEKSQAESALSSAQSELEQKKAEYAAKLATERNTVNTKKSQYISVISAAMTAVSDAGDALISTQTKLTELINSGVTLAGSVASNVYDYQTSASKSQVKEMEESQKAAKERGDEVADYLWQDEIDKAKEHQVEIKNNSTIDKTAQNAVKEGTNTINQLLSQEYKEKFEDIYAVLSSKKTLTENYAVPAQDVRLAATGDLYQSLTMPLTRKTVEKIMENAAASVINSTFLALVKAIASFLQALLTIEFRFDPDLQATVQNGNFGTIGGLPTQKNRESGSEYNLDSAYAEEDSQKSKDYKELLGAYSSSGGNYGSANSLENSINKVSEAVTAIQTEAGGEWKWNNWLKKLKKLWNAAQSLLEGVKELIGNVVDVLKTAIFEKALLAGYLAYNTANRTTYTGKAWTGASYNLPNKLSTHQGYAFYGAETEYILNGSYSEKENQQEAFNKIYLLRILLDAPFVLSNSQVSSLATSAGSVTFGIGTIVVYILYLAAEPFVDAVLLGNGAEIPILKTTLYLTPTGIPDLIKQIVGLSLTEAQNNSIYSGVAKIANKSMADNETKFPTDFKSAKNQYSSSLPQWTNVFTLDYTKHLLLLLMFQNVDQQLDRLANLIQMEATYNALANSKIGESYTFNLDKSFTYLRSSGTFTANQFIRISDTDFNSSKRIVYRGY